eukprot:CAMPEP_0204217844 /NCGR_PEP_ID=MMETSP0361-20130328/79196_1 /ASSEMBLY_ACC=CAM_ASM_000343 /TAXON_ID=268821 /ORGANISM="Scrippsiella Hangoei, Strain SHTV-5" /LENGTH=41 /DNA_ID= /DNA_START= /DNA_END= /DNA_ORIENTATION=
MSPSGNREWSCVFVRPTSPDSGGMEHFGFKAHVAREERLGG